MDWCGCVLIKLYQQTQAVGQNWTTGQSLPTLGLATQHWYEQFAEGWRGERKGRAAEGFWVPWTARPQSKVAKVLRSRHCFQLPFPTFDPSIFHCQEHQSAAPGRRRSPNLTYLASFLSPNCHLLESGRLGAHRPTPKPAHPHHLCPKFSTNITLTFLITNGDEQSKHTSWRQGPLTLIQRLKSVEFPNNM